MARTVPRAVADPTLVETESGLVRGVEVDGIVRFLGIPFAAPPVGELRWRMPQPAIPWREELAASDVRIGHRWHEEPEPIPMSEDCLHLNVWTPAARGEDPLPVMVWIFGGVTVHGRTALYPAHTFARHGVILVSMNYRLGRLGFFAHPALAAEAPADPRGNYGHADQLFALKWVQRNIAAFGGDPGRVTLFGESAGGASVLGHLASPLSQGLFRGAILQSPGVPDPRADALPLTPLGIAEAEALAYAASLGIEDAGAQGLAELRALPAETLIEGASGDAVKDALAAGRPVLGVVDAILDGRHWIEQPDVAIRAGRIADVPIIVGANDADLGVGHAATKDALWTLFGARAGEAAALYDPDGTGELARLTATVTADRTLIEPSRFMADTLARQGRPVWWYRFSYVNEAVRAQVPGTPHGFEIPFTLDLPAALVGDRVTPADVAMADLASSYWASFGTTLDPNDDNRPDWPRHDPAVDRVFNFTNDGAAVMPDPFKQRLDLWQAVQEERSAANSAPRPVRRSP